MNQINGLLVMVDFPAHTTPLNLLPFSLLARQLTFFNKEETREKKREQTTQRENKRVD